MSGTLTNALDVWIIHEVNALDAWTICIQDYFIHLLNDWDLHDLQDILK